MKLLLSLFFLPGVKLQGLRELRVVVVVVLVVVVVVVVVVVLMWCFFLHEHLTKTFAKQLLNIWEKYEHLLF